MWVVEGRSGVWLRKMGRKWDKKPIFHSPISRNLREVEDPSHSSLCKNQLTTLTDGKRGIFGNHQHSPPRRLVRMLAPGPPRTSSRAGCHAWESISVPPAPARCTMTTEPRDLRDSSTCPSHTLTHGRRSSHVVHHKDRTVVSLTPLVRWSTKPKSGITSRGSRHLSKLGGTQG